MLLHSAPYSFSNRARQSWRTLGYGGLAVQLLSNLHMSGSMIALMSSAFVLPSVWNFIESHRERNGDKMPAAASFQGGFAERRELGTVSLSPLSDTPKDGRSFEDILTEAASSSNQYGRRLSVICIKIPGLPGAMRGVVANLLRMHVRNTDRVEVVCDDEFIVGSPLLRDALAADVILKRLERALGEAELFSTALAVRMGKAVYPMHGYTGPDLIAHARSQLRPIATPSVKAI